MLKNELLPVLQKALTDELTAALTYKLLGEEVINAPTLACELLKHAGEEMAHWNLLIELASHRGMSDMIKIEIDHSVMAIMPTEKFAVINKVQALELKAIEDYHAATMLGRRLGDLEVERIFMGLLADEQEHFDDLANYTASKR